MTTMMTMGNNGWWWMVMDNNQQRRRAATREGGARSAARERGPTPHKGKEEWVGGKKARGRRPPRPTALCPPKKPSPTWRPVSNQPKPRALPQRSPKTSSDRLRCHLSRQRLWDPNLHRENSLNPLARQRLIVIFIRISLNCIMIRLIMIWFSRDLLIK